MSFSIDDVVEATLEAIPAAAEFDHAAREDARRVVTASVQGVFREHFSTKEVTELVTGLECGYGCWLNHLSEALTEGLSQMPASIDDRMRGRIEGGFQMIERTIFELEKHKYGQGAPFDFGEDR